MCYQFESIAKNFSIILYRTNQYLFGANFCQQNQQNKKIVLCFRRKKIYLQNNKTINTNLMLIFT